MLPENAAASVTDVLNYHQKNGHFKVPGRSFSAISLRLHTNGRYICGGKTLSFTPPSVCIIPEGVSYERISLEDDILVIHFRLLNCLMKDIEVLKISDADRYRRLFEKALRLRQENTPGAQYRENAVLYEILGALAEDAGLPGAGKDSVAESTEYMKQNFARPDLSIQALAKRANVSPAQYRRKFRDLNGKSPKQYLEALRFGYAKSLLETGYFSQTEIASRCGFSGVEYFRTAFKRETGKSVREYCREMSE